VVYGFTGIIVLVPIIRKYTESPSGYSILTMCLMLSVLALPTIFFYIYTSFNLVDKNKILTAESLGADKFQVYFYIIIPESVKGLYTAFLLGFGRTLSDTMIPLMLSGNALQFPEKLLHSARTLTSHIALVFPGEFDSIEFRIIFLISLLLFLISIIINIAVNRLEKNEL
jgi:phosphate transport system permease protein